MKKRMLVLALLLAAIALFSVGCKDQETGGTPYDTMESKGITTIEEFKTVPYMVTQGNYIETEDFGNKDYVMHISGTTLEEYNAYVKLMGQVGFKKHSDSGENGLDGYAYATSFKKDNLIVTVSYAKKPEMTYISVSYDRPLSEHLIYKDDYVKNLTKEKTKLHMLQMTGNQGSSFVYELKNGHFVVFDGGLQKESTNFINYLNDLTPGDEKPVIEAWFITHCHNDHYGTMLDITQKSYLLNQVFVNGFYYVEPSARLFEVLKSQSDPNGNTLITRAYKMFKTEDGGTPEFYRPTLGQKYYFCDIVVDISMTLEQIRYRQYSGTDFNCTSTWTMIHTDGQKMLYGGDGGRDSTNSMKRLYDKEYLVMDIFTPNHHGINVYDDFVELCTYDVVLYPSFRAGSIWNPAADGGRDDLAAVPQNNKMQAKAKEVYHHGDGSVTLTFPYTLGTAEIGEDWEDVYKPVTK